MNKRQKKIIQLQSSALLKLVSQSKDIKRKRYTALRVWRQYSKEELRECMAIYGRGMYKPHAINSLVHGLNQCQQAKLWRSVLAEEKVGGRLRQPHGNYITVKLHLSKQLSLIKKTI